MAENGENKSAVDNDGWTPMWEGKPKKNDNGGFL